MAARTRNDRTAGALTLLAILLASAALMLLPQVLQERRIGYVLEPSDDVDLTGLSVGSPVLVGGLERGRVMAIEHVEDQMGVPHAVVRIEIRREPPIYRQAQPILRTNPISQVALIDFLSVGSPGRGGSPLEAGSRLRLGSEADAESPFGGPLGSKLSLIGSRVGALPEEWARMGSDASDRMRALRDEWAALRLDVSGSWDGIVGRAQAAMDRFTALEADFTGLADELEATGESFDSLRALADEGQPVDRIRSLFGQAARSWQLMVDDGARLSDSFSRLQREWARSRSGLSRLGGRVTDLAEELTFEDVLVDLSTSANVFAKLYEEALAAPWRVLIPNESPSESRREQLDTMVRSLLEGAAEARAAREAIAAMVNAGGAFAAEASEVLERLQRHVDLLTELEEALWRVRFGRDRGE